MSQERSRQTTRKSQASVKAREARWSWPVVVYFATGGFGLAGAIVGYLIGQLWYRRRGDII